MELVEKIYLCETCKNYSKKIGGKMSEEFMSLGIERIIKSDIKESNIVDYKSYFYSVLLNVKRDYFNDSNNQSQSLELIIKDLDYTKDANKTYFSDAYRADCNRYIKDEKYEDNYKVALKIFINKDFKDDSKKFYQDLIKISLRRSKDSICKEVGIDSRKLNTYLDKANKLIKNEYNRLVSA